MTAQSLSFVVVGDIYLCVYFTDYCWCFVCIMHKYSLLLLRSGRYTAISFPPPFIN